MINYKNLGKRIKKLRLNNRLTQEKLSEIIDITEKYLSLIECGKAKASLTVYISLANAFDCSLDYLLGNLVEMEASCLHKMKALSYEEKEIILDLVDNFRKII